MPWSVAYTTELRSELWSRDKDPEVLRGGKNPKPQERVKFPKENVLVTPERRTRDWNLREVSSSGAGCRWLSSNYKV